MFFRSVLGTAPEESVTNTDSNAYVYAVGSFDSLPVPKESKSFTNCFAFRSLSPAL
jgi:hypothetical protein